MSTEHPTPAEDHAAGRHATPQLTVCGACALRHEARDTSARYAPDGSIAELGQAVIDAELKALALEPGITVSDVEPTKKPEPKPSAAKPKR